MSDSLATLQPVAPSRLLCPWEFPRQEYWRGLPFPSPGDLPDPGIKPESPPSQADSLPSKPPGKPTCQRRGRRFDPWSGKIPQAKQPRTRTTARKAAVTRSLGNQRGPRTAAKSRRSQRCVIFLSNKKNVLPHCN